MNLHAMFGSGNPRSEIGTSAQGASPLPRVSGASHVNAVRQYAVRPSADIAADRNDCVVTMSSQNPSVCLVACS